MLVYEVKFKTCSRCGQAKTLTTDNFYILRPTTTHPNGGWQAHCKDCWREVNRANKKRRAIAYASR